MSSRQRFPDGVLTRASTPWSPRRGPDGPTHPARVPADVPNDVPADVPADVPDGELAARACADAEAFGILYDRYSGQIYRMVHRRLRDRADAEDVTAEVFVKALSAIHTYRPARAPFWGWLHRIAANAVVDHVRARRTVLSLDVVTDDRPPLVSPLTGVEEQALHRVEAARVWRAVAELTPGQRTAVALRLAGDLPIADIASRMDRTEGAVKLLLSRGRTAIRIRLAERDRVPVVPRGSQVRWS